MQNKQMQWNKTQPWNSLERQTQCYGHVLILGNLKVDIVYIQVDWFNNKLGLHMTNNPKDNK